MSTSYGPGRYDPAYEVEGHDYPYRLRPVDAEPEHAGVSRPDRAAAGSMSQPLIDRVDLGRRGAGRLSRAREGDGALPLGVLIQYPDDTRELPEPPSDARRRSAAIARRRPDRINYALVGAGAFGTAMLVPQMRKRRDRFFLRGVVSRNAAAGQQLRARQPGRDPDQRSRRRPARSGISSRRDCDAASRACRSGRALARSRQARVRREAARDHLGRARSSRDAPIDGLDAPPMLMVGFNRRFSPALQMLKELPRGTPRAADDRVPAERRLHSARSLGPWRPGRRPEHRRSVPHVRRLPLPRRRAGVIVGRRRSIPEALPYRATTISARRSATRMAASRL